jgi:hypothetical protein
MHGAERLTPASASPRASLRAQRGNPRLTERTCLSGIATSFLLAMTCVGKRGNSRVSRFYIAQIKKS